MKITKVSNRGILIFLCFMLIGAVSSFSQVTLVAPANNSACQPLAINFDWNTVTNATSYEIQVSTSASFTSTVLDISGLSQSAYSNTFSLYDQTYYWKVTATLNDLSKVVSATWNFKTRKAEPTLLAPINGNACMPFHTTLSWNPAPTAVSYKVQVSNYQNFGSLLVNVSGVTATSLAVDLIQQQMVHYWRVSASFTDGCESGWSEIRNFRTTWQPPIIVAPVQDDKGISLTPQFSWREQTGVLSYTFQLSDVSDFSSTFTNSHSISSSTMTNAVYNYTTALQYNKTYYWHVSSTFTDCKSPWSNTYYFKTAYMPPNLGSPVNGASCVQLSSLYTWNSIPSAQGYRLQISTKSDFTELICNAANIANTYYNFTLPSPAITYYWRVRAEDNNNMGLWSPVYSFTSTIKTPALTYPMKDSTGYPVKNTFKWSSISPGTTYSLQIAKDTNFANIIRSQTGLTSASFSYTLPDYNTVYYWRVSATFTTCASAWSDRWNFKTSVPPPTLVSPQNNVTKLPFIYKFVWRKSPGATNYVIQAATDSAFKYIYTFAYDIKDTAATMTNFKPSTVYYWRVLASNPEGNSIWSSFRKFTTGIQGPDIPLMISPANNSVKQPWVMKFTWHKAARAASYDIRISDNQNFGGTGYNKLVQTLIDTTYSLRDTLDAFKTYYWSVRAKNDSGLTNWSGAWQYRTIAKTITDAPALWTPANNLKDLDLQISFQWYEVPYSDGYKLQVSKTDDFSAGNVVVAPTVYATSCLISNQFDYSTKYYWRTCGTNEAGDGPWSPVWAFTIKEDPTSVGDEYAKLFGSTVNPNPAGAGASLNFTLPQGYNVFVAIYDITGKETLAMPVQYMAEGSHSIAIDAQKLSTGTYWYVIKAGNQQEIGRFVVEK